MIQLKEADVEKLWKAMNILAELVQQLLHLTKIALTSSLAGALISIDPLEVKVNEIVPGVLAKAGSILGKTKEPENHASDGTTGE